jgi:hypothetical protein
MSFKDKNQTILSRMSDWERWLRPIKSQALGTEVWGYINPDITTPDGKTLTKPEVPKRLTNENDDDLEYRRAI